ADRPPIESGRVSVTAISIRVLRTYTIPGRKAEFDTHIRRAVKFLSGYRPRTGEEKAMRTLGLAWGDAGSALIREAASQLAAAQRTDGGWAPYQFRFRNTSVVSVVVPGCVIVEKLTVTGVVPVVVSTG